MKKITVGMLIAVTAILVIAAVPVYAQGGRPPETPGGRNTANSDRMGGGQDLEAAAEALGMTVEELQAEIAAGNTVSELMVASGVTPDWYQENLYNYSADRMAFLAEQLGMSVEDLQAALDGGSTVYDMAEAAGIEVPLWSEEWMQGSAGAGLEAGTGRMAEMLGMSIEEMEAAIADGSTIRDLFDAAGIDFPSGGAMGGGMNQAGR